MLRTRRNALFGFFFSATLLTAGIAQADLQTGGNQSNFGDATVAPGFTPDPRAVTVTSGGDQDVRALNLGPDCVGYATRRPDYILHLTGRSNRLRFYFVAANGTGDAALLVNTHDGAWRCNDDYNGQVNPLVEINGAGAGQYDIWVASYRSGEQIGGTLYVTELDRGPTGAAPTPSPSPSGGSQLNVGGNESNYGRASIAPGFVPDPRTVTVTSGGRLDVRAMNLGSGCVGYATRNPDYVVNLTGRSSRLRFYVVAPGDTSLVINDAQNRWQCNDDSYGGQNPTVTTDNAPAGQYDIWVGSYSSGENINGTLYITELDQHP